MDLGLHETFARQLSNNGQDKVAELASGRNTDEVTRTSDIQDLRERLRREVEARLGKGAVVWIDPTGESGKKSANAATVERKRVEDEALVQRRRRRRRRLAIDAAQCVLLCLTDEFARSAVCRDEAEYVATTSVPFVPLIVQAGFEPNDW